MDKKILEEEIKKLERVLECKDLFKLEWVMYLHGKIASINDVIEMLEKELK